MLEQDWQNNSIVQSCFNILYTAWRVDRGCSRMIEYAKPDLIRQPVHGIVVTSLFNFVISSFLTTCSIMHEYGCRFMMIVPTTLFKSVRPSSHEQSVPTCMNKPELNWTPLFSQGSPISDNTCHCYQQEPDIPFYKQILNDNNHVQACVFTCVDGDLQSGLRLRWRLMWRTYVTG